MQSPAHSYRSILKGSSHFLHAIPRPQLQKHPKGELPLLSLLLQELLLFLQPESLLLASEPPPELSLTYALRTSPVLVTTYLALLSGSHVQQSGRETTVFLWILHLILTANMKPPPDAGLSHGSSINSLYLSQILKIQPVLGIILNWQYIKCHRQHGASACLQDLDLTI